MYNIHYALYIIKSTSYTAQYALHIVTNNSNIILTYVLISLKALYIREFNSSFEIS